MCKKIKNLFLIVVISLLTTSCMTTKTSVGSYREQTGQEYTYSKGKQVWLFWGLLPLGRTNVNTPGSGNCQVVTRHNVFDVVLGCVTGGVITSHTIKVKAKKAETVVKE